MAEIANFIDVQNITYCGEEINKIWAQDLYNLDLRSYGITFMDGLKGKVKLYNGEIGDVWQAYSCPFSPKGEASLAESYIEPVAIKANLEQCYDVFWPTFLVDQTSISLQGGIPQTFGEWFFAKFREKLQNEYQEIFWKGNPEATKDYLKVTDGVEKQLTDALGNDVISGAAITVDNAIAQVEAVISAGMAKAAADELAMDGYKVFMNYADVQMLRLALGKLCCGNSTSDRFSNYAKEGDRIFIYGFEVVPTKQSKNTIIFGPARNLVLGFDTYDSHNTWKLIDMRETTGDNAFRIIALSNIGVGIVFPEAFVMSVA